LLHNYLGLQVTHRSTPLPKTTTTQAWLRSYCYGGGRRFDVLINRRFQAIP